MSFWRFLLASLAFHRRVHLAVALGVAAATAVLTGALVVGDSMRGSLRHLTLDRLGRIDDMLLADRFFRASLAAGTGDVPAILVEGSVARPAGAQSPEADPERSESARHAERSESAHHAEPSMSMLRGPARAGAVQLLGVDADFWSLGDGGPEHPPAPGEVVLNAPLADNLGARVGDEVILRVGKASDIPAESALGRKTDTSRSRRSRVSAIIPAAGLGRFGVRPSQQLPLNAYTDRATLAELLEQPDRANVLFFTGEAASSHRGAAAGDESPLSAIPWTLDDFGLALKPSPLGFWRLTSQRMLLDPEAVLATKLLFRADQPSEALTYLANTIADGDKQIPYSTITALDFATASPQGPFTTPEGATVAPLRDNRIAINAWAAEQLGAKVGDEIRVVYFEPDSIHGQAREQSTTFRLTAILAMTGPAADRGWTPEVRGVTDQKSIADWDPPFPFDSARVRKQDDDYWKQFGATPKAFVSLAAGQKLWSSRFSATRIYGEEAKASVTSIEIDPPENLTIDEAASRLARVLRPARMGMRLLPVKRMGLAASAGTTSFSGLFLGFSFFIVAAAMMLISILFRLGVQLRAREIGVLEAIGFRKRGVFSLLGAEGLLVAMAGAAIGVAAGVGYAWLMLAGLRTWWLAAVVTPFVNLYWTPESLVIGYVSGVVAAMLSILASLRRLRRLSPRALLAGETEEAPTYARRRSWAGAVALAFLLIALAAGFAGLGLSGEAQAGAFFAAGAAALGGLLAGAWARLRRVTPRSDFAASSFPLGRFAARNGARRPSRSALTMGLMASASFLIIAISAFRLDTAGETGLHSSSGGFALLATSAQPIYQDLSSPDQREELGFSPADNQVLDDARIFSLRVHAGDDASCLNLFQPTQPRILGAPAALIARDGFAWGDTLSETPAERENPWLLLETPRGADPADLNSVIPGVLDEATAAYSLHLKLGDLIAVNGDRGGKHYVRLVGLLKNSIFQGNLLVSEKNFLALFPSADGYRYFLIDPSSRGPWDAAAAPGARPADRSLASPARGAEARAVLEDRLGDYGFTAERTSARLASLMAVQNTYLATFQSLGGLGLLLGAVGLAAAQWRGVLERRGELALLRAVGFRRRRLAALVMLENAALLVGGLGMGTLAALVAVGPHLLRGAASLPVAGLGVTLGAVLATGLVAGLLAVRAALEADLLPALREE